MLWCGNSLSVRDLDLLLPPRTDTRVIASRGASGIDGTFSTAAGAALAHAADHPGAVAFALIGDLSLLHDAPGLAIGRASPGRTYAWSWSTTTAAASSRGSSPPGSAAGWRAAGCRTAGRGRVSGRGVSDAGCRTAGVRGRA